MKYDDVIGPMMMIYIGASYPKPTIKPYKIYYKYLLGSAEQTTKSAKC